MGSVFGKGNKNKDSRITEQDKAILNLKKTRDQLKKYQRKVESDLEKEKELAKRLLKDGKKDKAKLLLRKKKYQESILAKTDGQLDNLGKFDALFRFFLVWVDWELIFWLRFSFILLETLVNNLEFSQVEKQVIDGLKMGNESLKKANEMFSIDEIEQIMDDTAEAIAKVRKMYSVNNINQIY